MAVTGSDLSADRGSVSDLSPTSPILSFYSSEYEGFAMEEVLSPIGRDENGHRRLNVYAMPFVPRYLANTQTGSHSAESETGPTDWFGLSAPKFGTLIPNRIFAMEQVSTPIGRDENGRRRPLSADAMVFEPRNIANTESGSDSTESETGPVDWFGLSAPKCGVFIPNRIFVGGISPTATEDDLSVVFAQFGRVLTAKIIRDYFGVSKGYGFITFETEAEAKALCDKVYSKTMGPIMLHEHRLTVAPAVKKQVATPTNPVVEIAMHSAAYPNMGLADANMCYYLPQGPPPILPFGLPQQQFPMMKQMMQQPYFTGGYYHGGAGDPAAFQHAGGYLQAQGFPMQFHQAPTQILQGHEQVYQIPPYIQPHAPLPQLYADQLAQPAQYASYVYDGFPPQQVTGQALYPCKS